jgi:predicted alpha/beta-hydrolase family hydrolase
LIPDTAIWKPFDPAKTAKKTSLAHIPGTAGGAYLSGYHAEGHMSIAERFERGSVRGFVHHPEEASGDGVVLAHGAGANCDAKVLVGVADQLCRAGFHVLRIDLPFRQKRPSGPPSPATRGDDIAGLREASQAIRTLAPARIVLGGHSYGGRMSSMLAAQESGVADGLLLLSYPLHPPTKRDQLRTEHFKDVLVPTLFVHGTRDPFGLPEEMRAAIGLFGAPVLYSEVPGAGHDLRSGKFDVQELVVRPLRVLLAGDHK